MRYRAARLILLLALIPALAMATPRLEDGYTAFEQGDVNNAVAIWTELAEQGNATAQLNLGQLYRQGKGWYDLVMGPYDSRPEAQAAIDQLPEAVKANKPWVRTVGSLQPQK